jgi:hypothetical protein
MVFGDLLNLEGQVIDFYLVKGNSVEAKKGKVHKSFYYNSNEIQLQLVDKLGRCQPYTYHSIDLRGDYRNEKPKDASVYAFGWRKTFIFLNKEEAYKYVINNLRKQRQEINRKMLKAQMELYGKKIENNEG